MKSDSFVHRFKGQILMNQSGFVDCAVRAKYLNVIYVNVSI